MFNFLSWGKGVQSTALLVASLRGDWGLSRLDAVFHSDTHWERQKTYDVGDFYRSLIARAGVPLIEVSGGDVRFDGARDHIHLPFYTFSGAPLRRQCSRHFKIRPVRRAVREWLGFPASNPPHPPAGSASMWIGFSLDEYRRVNQVWRYGGVQYLGDRFPLIEKRLTRNDCIDYFLSLGFPVPVKSSCVGCPYRSASEWLSMIQEDKAEFVQACEFDEGNRFNPLAACGSDSPELYLWRGLTPLWDTDFVAWAARERLGVQLPLLV